MMAIPEITVQDLKALMDTEKDIFILDVRNPDEYAICHLPATLIPLKELPSRLSELNPEQQIVVYCHGGGRSGRAVAFLQTVGFKDVVNLRGGITAWAQEIDLTMAKY
jgi:sulfur-carrier protein adenylyltransferase/sulfurtransferase